MSTLLRRSLCYTYFLQCICQQGRLPCCACIASSCDTPPRFRRPIYLVLHTFCPFSLVAVSLTAYPNKKRHMLRPERNSNIWSFRSVRASVDVIACYRSSYFWFVLANSPVFQLPMRRIVKIPISAPFHFNVASSGDLFSNGSNYVPFFFA